jgi:hypothetical protein
VVRVVSNAGRDFLTSSQSLNLKSLRFPLRSLRLRGERTLDNGTAEAEDAKGAQRTTQISTGRNDFGRSHI